MGDNSEELAVTPLNALHRELGGRMVGFAGYDMPVQFEGIMAEHNHTRSAAGLFDVSHMGQVRLAGEGADAALERLVPSNIRELTSGRQRYTMLLNDDGGILDDLMVTRRADGLILVVNAACKQADIAHLQKHLPEDVALEVLSDRALLALQGPEAAAVLADQVPGVADMAFMDSEIFDWNGVELWISRSGYTGEDGYEISVPEDRAEALARVLLSDSRVQPIGLGARDSLRLEAGLCLFGHDIDTTTSPVEAGLVWAMQKRRRTEGGFPGAERIQRELAEGVTRHRVGLKPEGRAPVREGAEIVDNAGNLIGAVTSGGFGPSVGGPVAMGYIADGHHTTGTSVHASQRGKLLAMTVHPLPFSPHNYKR